jgi:hypothetical protein
MGCSVEPSAFLAKAVGAFAKLPPVFETPPFFLKPLALFAR